ncbi:redoxin domain-containing protein [Methanogenium sp. S4BF]|uniref:redoxin domain-containing protein n=1 Tax=Methanogenium sp. S4BF TaxID=1789226 RepID=UPI0024162DFC|nr:redoxin domain-containing protein [Methanogenium sp. S4BF]WFN35221.1 redoxin domain-containing protein [Methanogenium sp. S4BF]
MEQARLIRPGDAAKNFSLKSQHDKTVDLFEMTGKRVILSFHPLAWTDYCAAQMTSLEDNRECFERMNTVAVGISVDSLPCKRAWAETLGITGTPLLCDFWPHGEVARQYGIFREANGFSERATIIIDEDGTVARVKIYPVHSVPDIGEVIGWLSDMDTTRSTI